MSNNNSKSRSTNQRFKARMMRTKSRTQIKSSIVPPPDDSLDITIASMKRPKPKEKQNPSRNSTSKIKKPKFLSLRLQLSSTDDNKSSSPHMPTPSTPTTTTTTTATTADDGEQLNLFPLHPENLVEEKDSILPPDHDVISRYFFTSADGNATSLTDLLTAASSDCANGTGIKKEEEDEEAGSRYTWGTAGGNSRSGEGSTAAAEESLVKTAMRNKEREVSEVEKWVSISDVVEEDKKMIRKGKGKEKEEEVSSRWCEEIDLWRRKGVSVSGGGGGVMRLKLDYEEVLNAWSDKGKCSLYIGDEISQQLKQVKEEQGILMDSPPVPPPQTVPDITDDYFLFGCGPANNWGGSAGNGGLWTVPENTCNVKEENSKEGGINSCKLGQRKASLLRYKEKRQSRLFAKKIRYEVRKLNAEKRPRIKGRFVKRS